MQGIAIWAAACIGLFLGLALKPYVRDPVTLKPGQCIGWERGSHRTVQLDMAECYRPDLEPTGATICMIQAVDQSFWYASKLAGSLPEQSIAPPAP